MKKQKKKKIFKMVCEKVQMLEGVRIMPHHNVDSHYYELSKETKVSLNVLCIALRDVTSITYCGTCRGGLIFTFFKEDKSVFFAYITKGGKISSGGKTVS